MVNLFGKIIGLLMYLFKFKKRKIYEVFLLKFFLKRGVLFV